MLVAWWKRWRTLPVWPWLLGAYYFRRKNYDRAAEFYRIGLELRFDHRAARYAQLDYSFCLLKSNRWREAEHELISLIQDKAAPREAFILLSRLELYLGRPRVAAQVLKRLARRKPKDIGAKLCLMEALVAVGDPVPEIEDRRRELEVLKEELDLDHKLRPALETAIASCEIKFGNRSYGEKLLSRVIAGGAYPIESLVMRSKALLERGRVEQAKSALQRAIKLKPDYPFAYSMLARAYLMSLDEENVEAALFLAEESCRLTYWQNPMLLRVLADCYEVNEDPLAALLIAKKTHELAKRRYKLAERLEPFKSHVKRLEGVVERTDVAAELMQ